MNSIGNTIKGSGERKVKFEDVVEADDEFIAE